MQSPAVSPSTVADVSRPTRDPAPSRNFEKTQAAQSLPHPLFASIYHDLEEAIGKLGLDLSVPSLARRCVDHFFECLFPIMPIVYRPQIEFGLCLLQPGIQRREVDIQVFTLTVALCAMTATIVPSTIFIAGSLIADKFYCASKRSLDLYRATERGQLTSASIAIRYFQSGYTHSVGRPRTTWDELEEAIALMKDMQLHDEAAYAHMDEVESQLCRRLFWILFTGDKSAGILGKHHITLGRYVLESGITVRYTKSLAGEDPLLPQGYAGPIPTLITGFNLNQDVWRTAYLVLLEVNALQERYSGLEPGEEQACRMPTETELSRLGELYIRFETSLAHIPSYLRAHPTLSLSPANFYFCQKNDRVELPRAYALQRINVLVSYHCLRLVVVQAMSALLDSGILLWHKTSPLWPSFLPMNGCTYKGTFDPYPRLAQARQLDPVTRLSVSKFHTLGSESPMLQLQKIRIAEDMLYLLHTSTLENLRLNGESCVEKIRLVAASMLELIDNHPESPLANAARQFQDLYPHILAHMDSKASDSLSQDAYSSGLLSAYHSQETPDYR